MPAINRRQFLGAAAFGAAALSSTRGIAAGSASSPSPDSPPGRTVSLGLIGCGWWGMVNVKAAFNAGGARVDAVCDVDSEHLEKTAAEIETLQGSRPRMFKHYEEMLAAPGLEAVVPRNRLEARMERGDGRDRRQSRRRATAQARLSCSVEASPCRLNRCRN